MLWQENLDYFQTFARQIRVLCGVYMTYFLRKLLKSCDQTPFSFILFYFISCIFQFYGISPYGTSPLTNAYRLFRLCLSFRDTKYRCLLLLNSHSSSCETFSHQSRIYIVGRQKLIIRVNKNVTRNSNSNYYYYYYYCCCCCCCCCCYYYYYYYYHYYYHYHYYMTLVQVVKCMSLRRHRFVFRLF